VRGTVAEGGSVLFVGTKKQAQEAVAEQASRVGMPYVNHRWLGGMLTNFQTVYKRLQRMKELEAIDQIGAEKGYTKKETLQLQREKDKLTKTLGGLRDMQKLPAAIWVIDTKKEHIAVDEARKLGIPVIAVLDTNCDPDEVDFPIPGNDDAIRSAELLTRVVATAVADGLIARSGKATRATDTKPEPGAVAADEPLAEWERELLEGDKAKAAETGEAAPAVEAPAVEAPAAEAPAAEAPTVEAPAAEVSTVEAPAAE
jgi:small subunit ribosomal protein S2